MADIRIYNVDALGKPLGQYSHVTRVKANEHLFIAGMLAAGETFDAQCSGVFSQIEAALKSAGAGWASVVQFTTTSYTRRTSRSSCSGACANSRACFPMAAIRPTRSSSSTASSASST